MVAWVKVRVDPNLWWPGSEEYGPALSTQHPWVPNYPACAHGAAYCGLLWGHLLWDRICGHRVYRVVVLMLMFANRAYYLVSTRYHVSSVSS